jgi:GNAT superfamily N-acetyltransferase
MKNDYTIQREKFADIMDELPWLFARQYGEVILDKDGLQDDVDYNRYVKLEELGILHCLTVRCNGVLVGYFFNMIIYHLHHKGIKTCSSDMIYILPGHRKGGVGLWLLRMGISEMKKLGVQKMYIGAKIGTRFGKLLKKLDFCAIEETHSKWIGE